MMPGRHTATLVRTAFAALLLTHSFSAVRGQAPPPPGPDRTIDAAERKLVLDRAMKELDAQYVFPEVAAKMNASLRERLARGEYEPITSGQDFAQALTEHLQAVSHDKHLRVRHSAEPFTAEREASPEERQQQLAGARWNNFGFERVERLPGNIGYIQLFGFAGQDEALPVASAAMNFVANADALIVDLRRNGGGSPRMVAWLTSYLFDDRVHLNDLYWRADNETEEFWTDPKVPGDKFGKTKPVYVLTSNYTFSGAEEFSYNLRNLRRATLVGETTGGGAHPGGRVRLNDHFAMFVPRGRAISPITKTNWEGTGVEPHLKVAAKLALKAAHVAALETLTADPANPRRDRLREVLAEAKKELEALRSGS